MIPVDDPDNDAEFAPGLASFLSFFKAQTQPVRDAPDDPSYWKEWEKLDDKEEMGHSVRLDPFLLLRAFNELGTPDRLELAEMLEAKTSVGGLVDAVTAEASVSKILHPGPTSAPELYDLRSDERESVVAFIERVYRDAGHLNGFFGRQHLRKLDQPCVKALENWERAHGPAPIDLPKKSEITDRLLAPDVFVRLPEKEQRRLRTIQRRREWEASRPEPS